MKTVPEGLRGEAERVLSVIRAAVGDHAEVLEVGSTAVSGVIGKGDIDILVRSSAEHFEIIRSALDAIFARDRQQMSNEQYQGYRVASDYDVAIQLTVTGCVYDTFTDFLDALRSDPANVAAYNQLKRSFDGAPMDEYRRAKGEFIEKLLSDARGDSGS